MSACNTIEIVHEQPSRHDTNMARWIVIGVVVAVASYPMFTKGLLQGHDLTFHLARIESIAQGIRDGALPVRLYGSQAFGFGYATGICYPDLFLYPSALLVCAGFSLMASYKLFVVAVNIATALIAENAFRRVFASSRIGLSLAVMWTLSPYRLCNVLLRAAVGEYLAMTFMPLLVLGLCSLFLDIKTPAGTGWVALALGMSGVIMSHMLSVVVLSACGAISLIPLLLLKRKGGGMLGIAKAIGLTLVLCAGFLLPFVDYYSSHDMAVKHGGSVVVAEHAVEPVQILMPFQPFRGLDAKLGSPLGDEMPLGVGWSLLSSIPLALTFFSIVHIRKPDNRYARRWAGFLLVMSVVLLIVTTYLFPWNYRGALSFFIKGLSVIQFPWRFLGVASLYLLLLLGIVMSHVRKPFAMVLPLLCVLALCEAGFSTSTFVQNASRIANGAFLSAANVGWGEYLPASLGIGFEREWPDGFVPMAASPDVTVERFERTTTQSASVVVHNGTDDSQAIRLPMFWHDQLVIDSRGAEAAELPTIEPDAGYASLVVGPRYDGTVLIRFAEPITWRLAEATSIAGVVGLAVIGGGNAYKRRCLFSGR